MSAGGLNWTQSIGSGAANLLSFCERIHGETRHHSPNTTPGALAHAGM